MEVEGVLPHLWILAEVEEVVQTLDLVVEVAKTDPYP